VLKNDSSLFFSPSERYGQYPYGAPPLSLRIEEAVVFRQELKQMFEFIKQQF
jgi:hypothetical protein